MCFIVRRWKGPYGCLGFSERQDVSSRVAADAFFPESVLWLGTLAGATVKPFAYSGSQFSHYHTHRDGIADAPPFYGGGYLVGGFAVYFHQCGVCDGAYLGGCGIHLYDDGLCNIILLFRLAGLGSNDADELLCNVLYGEYFFVQSVGGA